LTGRDKSVEIKWPANSLVSRYHQYELLTNELKDAYAASSIVVCRAGLGTLTELANLAKPLILIPLPNTHQEDNADYLKNKKAVLVLDQKNITAEILFSEIKKLLSDENLQAELSQNITQVIKKHATSQIIDLIFKIKHGRV
jgi:UDP-N-acetylglucosamine--N-acetylmuramyl-(pentapeptide) pyrophosphoryl-undecaprenol N-acetylglucosamine transferase